MILPARIFYSLTFAAFLANHLVDFSTRYIKFATIRLVNEYNIHYFYFFMVGFELVSVLVPFIKLPKALMWAYDALLAVYCIVVPAALICLYELTNGCPECHFITSSFTNGQYINCFLVLGLGVLYLFVLRDGMKKMDVA